MRAAPVAYPRQARRYTTVGMPGGGDVQVPLWDRGRAQSVADELAGTPYEGVYALSRRLVADAATPYDAAAAIESHLQARYRYDEEVPEHEYPLEAFLFEDRSGYCQQFSGAMALMLRLGGIPARVASGFTPGGVDPDRGTFRVEDLDAHSWVEVFFPGIGWVPFDPTPARAPAEAQLGETGIIAAEPGEGPAFTTEADGEQAQRTSDAGGRTRSPQVRAASSEAAGPHAGLLVGGAALGLGLLGALLYAARATRRRLLDPDGLATAELAELRSAVRRLGWELSPQTTLLQLERRLASTFGRDAWLYAVRLRERRFRDPSLSPPGARERRRLRRALLAGAGARGLLALPPGGPRRNKAARF
jgi:hypothetical protein